MQYSKNVGLLGFGALGQIIGKEIYTNGVKGARLSKIFDLSCKNIEAVLGVSAQKLWSKNLPDFLKDCDIIIEALPPDVAAHLIPECLKSGKTVIALSLSVLVTYEDLFKNIKDWPGRLIIPSGSIAGLDGIKAMRDHGITTSRIITTKSPRSFAKAKFISDQGLNLSNLTKPYKLYEGTVRKGAAFFPANVNVAVALAIAGTGVDKTCMEVWVDPDTNANTHKILVESKGSILEVKIQNKPDPDQPGSSVQAAYSALYELKNFLFLAN
mgnify:CR=1 FL=1